MAFVKLVKTVAYFKRYQTRYRRRREGRTDYYARKRLITQDKDKFNTPKYRLVARITNSRVICQVIYQTLKGDVTICQANSQELRKYGLTAGLANYSAAYATGLLIARRLLKKYGMDSIYKGNQSIDGVYYNTGDESDVVADRRPFHCVLDVGLANITTGCKCLGVLKGAVDGGLSVPHSDSRFPGAQRGDEDAPYKAEDHRERIFGVHIDKYMKYLKDEGAEDYKKQFAKWDACLKKTGAASVEALFTKIQAEIRANPEYKKVEAKKFTKETRNYKLPAIRLTHKQRKDRALKKYNKVKKALGWR